jgi:hypothetical protein
VGVAVAVAVGLAVGEAVAVAVGLNGVAVFAAAAESGVKVGTSVGSPFAD